MKTHIISFRFGAQLLLVSCFGLAHGQGSFLMLHQGATDPTTEGFSVEGYGRSQAGPVSNDLGVPAWATQVTDGALWYVHTLPALDNVDWLLSVEMRVLTLDLPGGFQVGLSTGSRVFGASFGTTAAGDPVSRPATYSGERPVIVLQGAGPSYHKYELLYSAGTQTTSFWIDGAKQVDNLAGWSSPDPIAPGVSWGAMYQSPSAIAANWHHVSLQIIPEPSAWALLVLGGGALLVAARRGRQRRWIL